MDGVTEGKMRVVVRTFEVTTIGEENVFLNLCKVLSLSENKNAKGRLTGEKHANFFESLHVRGSLHQRMI